MATRKANEQKKEHAKLLYLTQNLSFSEIEEKVGVTRKTIAKWAEQDGWENEKASVVLTKEEELRRVYLQIKELNQAIADREQGKRYATASESDTLVKLSTTISRLETEVSLAETISAFKRFGDWLRQVDLEKAKEFVKLQSAFIKELLTKL